LIDVGKMHIADVFRLISGRRIFFYFGLPGIIQNLLFVSFGFCSYNFSCFDYRTVKLPSEVQMLEQDMTHYMLRWQFSSETAKNFVLQPQDRSRPAREFIEGFGGKLESYYFALGDYDGVGIAEFPDTVSVTAASMLAASTGAFARFETTPLLTTAEAMAAMKMAKAKSSTYKAPNA